MKHRSSRMAVTVPFGFSRCSNAPEKNGNQFKTISQTRYTDLFDSTRIFLINWANRLFAGKPEWLGQGIEITPALHAAVRPIGIKSGDILNRIEFTIPNTNVIVLTVILVDAKSVGSY